MPTAKKAKAPKYCVHKPSGRAYVRIRGQFHYIGEHGTRESLEAYGRIVVELAAQPDVSAAVRTASTGLTVVELADAYHEYCKGYYRKKDGTPSGWLDHIQLVLDKHLSELYGRTPAADFEPKAFKAIRQPLVDAGNSRPYVNKLMPIVTRCFKWGASEELIPTFVYHGLTAVEGLRKGRTTAREPAPILPVEGSLVDATLPYLPPIVADMLKFQRLTGCRPGEVCQLRPMDLDRSGEVWTYRPASHKTEHHDNGRERIIFIGPQAQAVILPYLLRDAAAHCFSAAESETKRHVEIRARRKSKLTPSQPNRRKAQPMQRAKDHYTKDSYARAIRRGVAKANKAILEDAKEIQTDTGTQKEVEAALDMRWPTIEGKQDTAFYVVDIKKGKDAVYFQHQGQLSKASKQLEDLRTRTNPQQRTVTRKPPKKKRPN
jgi:integrase